MRSRICHDEISSEEAHARRLAREDFWGGFLAWRIWLSLGLHDVKIRYRRTILGPLWITLGMVTMFVSMGMLFSALYKDDVRTLLPYLGVGLVLWTFGASTINEATLAFQSAQQLVRSLKSPLTIHVLRCVVRNGIIFLHNAAAVFIVSIALGMEPGLITLLVLVTLPLFLLALHFSSLILATLGARFRDIGPVVSMLLQMLFFLTPIIWSPANIPNGRKYWIIANPIYHLIECVRAPLLGKMPETISLVVATGMTIALAFASYMLYVRFRRRIPYWL